MKVRSSKSLTEAVARVKRQNPEFTTSFFAPPGQTQAWIDRGLLHSATIGPSVLVFRPAGHFVRLYHVAESQSALSKALDYLNYRLTWVADLVNSSENEAAAHCYETHGFMLYATLVRMSRIQNSYLSSLDSSYATFARSDDLAAVADFLSSVLDPYVDQIPDEQDLALAIQREELLIVRKRGGLDGVLLFEKSAAAAHLRYWYVAPSMKNQGIGAQLMAAFLNLCQSCRRIVLWVSSENSDALSKYQRYGFRREDLVDRIMVRKAQPLQEKTPGNTETISSTLKDFVQVPETDAFHV